MLTSYDSQLEQGLSIKDRLLHVVNMTFLTLFSFSVHCEGAGLITGQGLTARQFEARTFVRWLADPPASLNAAMQLEKSGQAAGHPL